jgi:hypothetical protein
VKGGFFLGKKPLEYVLSVYTISENAAAVPISRPMLPALATEGCTEGPQIIPQGLKPICLFAVFRHG